MTVENWLETASAEELLRQVQLGDANQQGSVAWYALHELYQRAKKREKEQRDAL